MLDKEQFESRKGKILAIVYIIFCTAYAAFCMVALFVIKNDTLKAALLFGLCAFLFVTSLFDQKRRKKKGAMWTMALMVAMTAIYLVYNLIA